MWDLLLLAHTVAASTTVLTHHAQGTGGGIERSGADSSHLVPMNLGDNNSVQDPSKDDNMKRSTTKLLPSHRTMVGDWIIQWDPVNSVWFFYNIKTGSTTNDRPDILRHLDLPSEGPASQTGVAAAHSNRELISNFISIPRAEAGQGDFLKKTTVDKDLNGTSFSESRNFGGSLFYDSLAGIYDNIVKSYVEAVYTDVIEGYTIATIKLVGWFTFGSFLILKGLLIRSLSSGGSSASTYGAPTYGARSFDGPSLTQSFSGWDQDDGSTMDYVFPLTQDFQLTFPVDNSLLTCYQGRQSCVRDQAPQELSQFVTNLAETWEFLTGWVELAERIGHMVMEGETEL